MAAESIRAASRWTTRTIPIVLAAAVGYVTYVTVARICSDYLINRQREYAVAIVILILYFILLLLMVATYLRTIVVISTDPGLVTLGPAAIARRENEKNNRKLRNEGGLETQPYYTPPDSNPDSPGLEQFYTKDVFVCENDGRPKWCSDCCNWKPDRAHHSSEINRCVYRMDHYCPWVGGIVGENSFKFFTQFTMYTACFCGLVLGAAGSTLRKQLDLLGYFDVHLIAVMALGGFFGLFTFTMTMTNWRYISINMTNVDMLGAKSKVYQLAVRLPHGSDYPANHYTITYPLPKPEQSSNVQSNVVATNGQAQHDGTVERPMEMYSARDALASRTFAVLRTEQGENPWDVGFWHNWKEVMGTNPLDWFLPLRRSPCTKHDIPESFYRMGPKIDEIRARSGIDGVSPDETDRIEMRNINQDRVR